MTTGFPFYDALVSSEEAVPSKVIDGARLPIDLVIRGIDVLLAMSGYHGPNPSADPDSPDGNFHWWASERARQSPFSMRAAILLWERGHYIECVSVNRHLIESLVQLRYFARRKAALGAQLLATSRKERISFKAMFEDVSPGLYDSQYMTASGVEHSGMALSAFFNYMPPDREAEFARSVPKLRCEYDQRAAGWTANALAMLCAGFLQHYPSWFDGYATVAAQDDMETLRQGTLAIFTEFRSGLRQIAPKPAAFDVWDRLVGRTIRK